MNIGNNFALRWSTSHDISRIAQAASQGFSSGPGMPTQRIAEAVYRLMRGDCPAMGPDDFCLIEDKSRQGNSIVACLCAQRYEWNYEGISLHVARPEIVTSLPEYRHRGLVRSLFAAFHARSEAEGCDLQAIVGIPYFYHRLGYAYALNLDEKWLLSLSFLRSVKAQPYTLREATLQDIPFLQRCYKQRISMCYRLWAAMSDAQWSYYIKSMSSDEQERIRSIKIFEDEGGHALGMLVTQPRRWWKTLHIYTLELAPDLQWSAVLPGILATIRCCAELVPVEVESSTTAPLEAVECDLGFDCQ